MVFWEAEDPGGGGSWLVDGEALAIVNCGYFV